MKLIGLQLVAVATLFAVSTLSVEAATAQVPLNRQIVRLQQFNSYVVVRISPAFANGLGCAGGATGDDRVVLNYGASAALRAQLALLLVAFTNNYNIGLGLQDVCHPFGGGVPTIYRVDIEPPP
jgi:hypothetical protein